MRVDTQTIKSFVLRSGRMTKGQRRGLEHGWPIHGLCRHLGILDWNHTFRSLDRRNVEIGFGMGDSLISMARNNPNSAFVGIEVHLPGVGRLLSKIQEESITNIKIYCDDAVNVFTECIAESSVDAIQIFFPDPWPKKKHHKRRLIQSRFIGLVTTRLRVGGRLHVATDWAPYADYILEVLEAESSLQNLAGRGFLTERPIERPETKFEKRATRHGNRTVDLLFKRV